MTTSTALARCNCFALRQAARFVTQIYEQHLAPFGLTPAQFTILSQIAESPGIGMAELSSCMVMERTSLVRALSPLQREGWVVSKRSDRAPRAHELTLSAAGKAMLAKALHAWESAQDEFESKVGRDRAKLLREDLFDLTSTRA